MNTLAIVILTFFLAEPKFFDPDGYYFPMTELFIAGDEIEDIELTTLTYYVNGKLDYENPKKLSPEVRIKLTKSIKTFSTKQVIVNRDTLYFSAKLSTLKVLEFSGNFIDKRGQYWDQKDVLRMKTVILEGVFTTIENGIRKETKKVKLAYWEGD